MVLFNTCAQWTRGPPQTVAEHRQQDWGRGRGFDVVAPSVADDAQFLEWAARFERLAASPGMHA